MSLNTPINSNPYHISHWGNGYFSINHQGELEVDPTPEKSNPMTLSAISQKLEQEGLRQPILIRFPDILEHRVLSLRKAFSKACDNLAYKGEYQAIYPIKVNQQRPVVERIIKGQVKAGFDFVGLEAGSKPELIAVLALVSNASARIVCNGYKDEGYIRLALMAEKLGHEVFLVIEKPAELDLILREAKRLGVTPRLGVRAKLASIGKGKWQNSGGEKSKFGLSCEQIVRLIQTLREYGYVNCLNLLHFHLGSQLANIRDIQTGLKEAGRIYAELTKMELDIQWLDVGGGLGVDYEGTRSRSYCSMNYSLDEYAKNVVETFYEVCEQAGIKEPGIMTESGRAMTAHHALLLSRVSDMEVNEPDLSFLNAQDSEQHTESATVFELKAMSDLYQRLQTDFDGSLFELSHDCQHWLENARQGFIDGRIRLQERAQIEALTVQINKKLIERLSPNQPEQRALLDEIKEVQASKLFVNFSLFQSLPDAWGIAQIFPIMPIKKLNQRMDYQAVIQDITCDSDGRINQYVGHDGLENTLTLPEINTNMELVFCLVGAYQEILGDMHNLFGDTDSVDVSLDESGEIKLEHCIAGDCVRDVLDYVNYDLQLIHSQLQHQVEHGQLDAQEKRDFASTLESSLDAYTYLIHS